MSATKTSTAGSPDSREIAAAADSARARSRPVMPTRAPMVAKPIAAARPMPPVPPVIRTVLPVIDGVTVMVSSPFLRACLVRQCARVAIRWPADPPRIDSAIEIDLTGQVVADSIGSRPYSGLAIAHPDFRDELRARAAEL